MKSTDMAAGDALLPLTPEQRETLAGLIEAERKSATRWWTFLNEMRARGELPDWVYRQFVGTHGDLSRYESDCEAVNRALFGKKRYIRHAGEPVFVSWLVNCESNRCEAGGDPIRNEVNSFADNKPDAVRQHRSGQTTLGSTNARIQS